MPPYTPHCHVYKSVAKDRADHQGGPEQLLPMYENRMEADAQAERLTRAAQGESYFFHDVCYTDPRVCLQKIAGLTALSQLPAVYTEDRKGIIYKPPELRFQWVRPEHPYSRSPEFCQHRHKTPLTAYKCQEDTERRYRRLGMEIAPARLIVIYPDGFRDWYPKEQETPHT